MARIEDKVFRCWVMILGSNSEAENYLCSISIENKKGQLMLMTDHPTSVENCDEKYDSMLTFTVPTKSIKSLIDEKFRLSLKVKIQCLKDEAKDDDLDSGVSNAGD